ncbi:MAG: glutamate--tRNA ligase family protein [bacterium]
MDYPKLAELLLPNVTTTPDFWYGKYPRRDLPKGAFVTRLGPSPTGFLHVGALYTSLIGRRIAHDSGGVFIVRIEDTDSEREVAGARGLIVKGLAQYGLSPDEGLQESVGTVEADLKHQKGNYGPYIQSARKNIYISFVKDLIKRGLAYPCFMTSDELTEMRNEQELAKVRPGYYGKYAKWRDASMEAINERLASGATYCIRLRANGDQNKKQSFTDEFLGELQIPENDEDFIILKTSGGTTYHLAHIVDDYLMGTNFVTRGEEWLSSLPKHLALWRAFDFKVPKYGHIMPINKQDGGSVRKLSKRKDPEANIEMYVNAGYPEDAIIGYLYRLANPSFDEWWQSDAVIKSKTLTVRDFPFSIEGLKRGGRGPLVDMKKLDSISGDIVVKMTVEDVAEKMIAWAEKHDPSFAKVAKDNHDYFTSILSIERDTENPRKDIVNWEQGKGTVDYFFDDFFDAKKAREILSVDITDNNQLNTIIKDLGQALSHDSYYTEASLDAWVDNVKKLAEILGFAVDRKKYKETPTAFKGDFAMFMKIVRVSITGREKTPNLFYILKVMGKDRVVKRLAQI